LAYFSIQDRDLTSDEPEVKLILGEEYFQYTSGFLVLKKELDREKQNLIPVAISACDSGRPKKCSTTEMNFIITGTVLTQNSHAHFEPINRL